MTTKRNDRMEKYAVYKILHLLLVLVLISRSSAIPVRSKRSNVQDLPLLHEDYDGDDYGTDNSRDPIVDDGTSHLSPLDERGSAHIQGHVEYIDNLHGNRSDNGDPTGSSDDLGSDGNVRDIDIDNNPNGQSEPNLEPDISRGETLNENIPDEHIDSDNVNVQSQSGLDDNHNSSSAQQDRGETFSTTRPNGDGQYVINAVGRAVHTVNASTLGEQQSELVPHTSKTVSTNTPGDRQNPHGFLMGGQVMDTTSEGYRAQHGFLMGGDIQNVDNEHNSNTLTTKLPTSTLSSSTTPTPEPFITVRLSNMSSHELTESSSPVRTYNNDIVIDRTDQSNGRRGDTDNAQLAGQDNSHDTDTDSTTEVPLTSEGQVATLPSRQPNVHEHGHENGLLNGHGETVGNGNGIDVPIDKGEHPHNGNSEENNEPGHPRHTNNPVARTPDRQDNLPVTEFVMTTPNRIILPTPANLEPEERDISSSIHEPQSTVTVHNGENEHIEPSNEGRVNPGESWESGNQGNNGQSNNSGETHVTTSEGHIEFVTELPEIYGDNAIKPNKNLPKDSDRKSGDMPFLSLSTTSTSVTLSSETENHFPASSSIPGSEYENSVHNPTDKTVQTMDILHSSTVTYSESKHTCIQTGNMLCPARSISATREQLFPSNSATHVQFTDAFQSVRVGLEETTPVLLFETSTTHQPHVIPKNTRTSLPDQFIIPTNSIFPTKTVDENIYSQSIERSIAVPAESIVPTQSSRHVGSSITKHLNDNIDGSPSITSSMPPLVPTSSEVLHTSGYAGAHASQIHSSTDTSRHDSPVYSSIGTTVVQSSLENVLQTQYMSSEAIHANTDHGLPVVSSMPVQSSQELTPQVVLTTTSAHQSPQSSVTFPMLTSNPTTKKKVEHSTTPAVSTSHSTQKKPNSDKEPDKPNIVGGSSSSSVSSTTTTTTTSSPHILSTTLPTSTARPATTQKLETSTQPSVYIEIRLKMGWSQFRTSKIEFIAGIREIILSEKGYIVDDEQFVLSTEDGPSSMEGENIQIITIKMYFVDNDGKLDILLTTETPSFILKGFHQSNFLKDKLVSVHTVNRKPPELLPEARPERRREPPNVTMVIVLASMGGVCCVALIILQVLIHRRVKAKRKQRQFIGHRASLQSMDHVALGVIPKSRPSSGYWNPALDDTLELPEPEEHSHILNFSGLANFCMDTKAIYSEFQAIPHDDVESSSIPIGEDDKNRFANVLPHKHNRVYLNKTQENKSGYINANYVDGYMGEKRVYIATQSPMVNTVDDFWRMVWEQQTRTILMLNPMTSQGKPKQSTCYWPDNLETDNQREFQDYIVTLKKRDVQQDYVECTLEIIDIEKNLKREIHHFWFTCWSDTGPPEPLTFVKFVLDTRPHYENSGSPALVHCGPGTGRTGTFIAVDICMRMFEDRRRVDIQSCVHKLRGERAGAVQTKEQYFLIYQALNEYAVILSSPSISTRSSVITLHAML